MQIGDLAKKCKLSVRSLRYYEELGLIRPISHSEGGFRLYTEQDIRKLDVINYLKTLGLSLNEIREIFNARNMGKSSEETINLIIGLLKEKLRMTNLKIAMMKKIKREIFNTIDILTYCKGLDFGVPMFHEKREVCEKCNNLKARQEIPKMISMFF